MPVWWFLAAAALWPLLSATFNLPDTAGVRHTSAEVRRSKAAVFAFIATDCPISKAYAPELARLHAEYAPRGVAFLAVHSDPAVSAPEVRRHVREFGYPFPTLLDPKQTLARALGVKVTLEVAVVSPEGRLLYRGRVDDRYVDFGKTRPAAHRQDLRAALEQILAQARNRTGDSRAGLCHSLRTDPSPGGGHFHPRHRSHPVPELCRVPSSRRGGSLSAAHLSGCRQARLSDYPGHGQPLHAPLAAGGGIRPFSRRTPADRGGNPADSPLGRGRRSGGKSEGPSAAAGISPGLANGKTRPGPADAKAVCGQRRRSGPLRVLCGAHGLERGPIRAGRRISCRRPHAGSSCAVSAGSLGTGAPPGRTVPLLRYPRISAFGRPGRVDARFLAHPHAGGHLHPRAPRNRPGLPDSLSSDRETGPRPVGTCALFHRPATAEAC